MMRDEADTRDAGGLAERRHRAILQLAALDKSDFDAVLHRILVSDAEELGVDRVNCWKLETAPEAIRCVCGVVRGKPAPERGTRLFARDIPTYFQAVVTDPIILIDDAHTDWRAIELQQNYILPLGIRSFMDVPIWVRGALWGVICHEQVGEQRHWTEADRDFAVSIGHIVSMAVEASERAEAERALRGSELFVGILSHDLRNPLNVLRMSAEHILARTHVEPACDDSVGREAARIVRNVDHMSRMVSQLLDFTRIRIGGGLPVERTEVDLAEIVRRVVSNAQVSRPGLSIGLQLSGDTHGRWDPDRIWQLLSNLVSNAVDYGHDVQIIIDGRDPNVVFAHVQNRGTIDPEIVPNLFEPFRRRDGRGRDSGLGLGLFIAREIANAHGGSITLESSESLVDFTIRLSRRGESRAGSGPHRSHPPRAPT